ENPHRPQHVDPLQSGGSTAATNVGVHRIGRRAQPGGNPCFAAGGIHGSHASAKPHPWRRKRRTASPAKSTAKPNSTRTCGHNGPDWTPTTANAIALR